MLFRFTSSPFAQNLSFSDREEGKEQFTLDSSLNLAQKISNHQQFSSLEREKERERSKATMDISVQ
jgi:hypothetical protein